MYQKKGDDMLQLCDGAVELTTSKDLMRDPITVVQIDLFSSNP